MTIIGRVHEQQLLNKVFHSHEAEFMVVYGRRRVGKTYLVREFFRNKPCQLLHATGLQQGNQKAQLKKFAEALSETFFEGTRIDTPRSWGEAFEALQKQVIRSQQKIVIFLDELPWMATRKSGLMQEIDYYWNRHWSAMPNVVLVVCGSSASWLINKIIYNKGGLHNRVTCQIKLAPFDLAETATYLKSRKIKLNKRHILSIYMAMGGIPYYLKYVDAGKTAEQNIQHIFFGKNAPLYQEFNKLFGSLFESADAYIELIQLIAKVRHGVKRADLKSLAKLSSGGGRLSKRLKDLVEAGFIEEYTSWGRTTGEYYKLIDEFCLFYLYWVQPLSAKQVAQDYWLNQSQKPGYFAWSGLAFEAICIKHINAIVCALKIKVGGVVSTWQFHARDRTDNGAQIDLVIEREDDAMTLCEIKYTDQPFTIDKQYALALQRKMDVFAEKTKTKKQLFIAMISANGLKPNDYSREWVDGVVTLDDLF